MAAPEEPKSSPSVGETAPAGRQAEQGVREAASAARGTAAEALRGGRDLLERQRHLAAEEVEGIAKALRGSVRQLHEQRQESIAGYAEWSAEGLSRLASLLRERDAGSLLRQVNDFARRQPALFFGGALATGFLISRFARSGREKAEEGRTIPAGPGNYPYSTVDVEEPALVIPPVTAEGVKPYERP